MLISLSKSSRLLLLCVHITVLCFLTSLLACGEEVQALVAPNEPIILRHHTQAVTAVNLSRDGTKLLTGGLDSRLAAYTVNDSGAQFVREMTHEHGIHDIDYILLGPHAFIASCSRTRWPNTSGTLQLTSPDREWSRRIGGVIGCHFNAIALSDAGLIAVGGNDKRLGNLRVFNLSRLDIGSKKKEGSLDDCEIIPTSGSFPSPVTSLSFAPILKGKMANSNSNTLAVGCSNGIIRLVSITTKGIVEKPTEFVGHSQTASIVGLTFSSNGQRLISAGTDSTIRFWEILTGKEDEAFRVASPQMMCFGYEPQTELFATGHAMASFASTNREQAIRRYLKSLPEESCQYFAWISSKFPPKRKRVPRSAKRLRELQDDGESSLEMKTKQ